MGEAESSGDRTEWSVNVKWDSYTRQLTGVTDKVITSSPPFIYKLNTVDTVWESAGVHSLTQMYLWGVQHSVQDLGEVYNPPASTPLVQISSRLVYACTVRKVARGNTGQLFLWQLIQVCHSQRDNKEQYCCIPLEDWKGKYILFLSRDLPQAMTKGLGVEL